MDNNFFLKRIAVKGFPIFSQKTRRRTVDRIELKAESQQISQPAAKSSADIMSNFKSLNRKYKTNVYKCRFFGCGKIFFNSTYLKLHNRRHFIRNPLKSSLKITVRRDNSRQSTETRDSMSGKQPIDGQHYWTPDTGVGTSNRWSEPSTTFVSSNGFSSSKKVRMHFTSDRYLGQMRCICNFCGLMTYGYKSSARIAVHINGKHLRNQTFKCDVEDCHREFYAPNSLRNHKMNHLCGFGIENGKTMATVCGNQSINRFRIKIVIKGDIYFKCSFGDDCHYITKGSAIKRHIHDKHLCPNRELHSKKYLTVNSVDVMNRLDDFCLQLVIDGKRLFKCKECKFFTEKLRGFVAHIKLKHFAYHQNNGTEPNPQIYPMADYSQPYGCPTDSYEMFDSLEDKNRKQLMNAIRKSKVKKKLRTKQLDTIEWKPFNCHICCATFNDLLFLRNHLKVH